MPYINNLRRNLAKFIFPDQKIYNPFNSAFLSLWGGGFTAYDTNQQTYLEKGYGYNPDVYAVINQMATKAASVPYYFKKVEDDRYLKKLSLLESSTKGVYSPQQLFKKKSLEIKAYDSDTVPFPLDRPNVNQTWNELISLYETFIRTTGNCYFYLLSPDEGPNVGRPVQIYVLPAHLMEIVLKPNADLMSTEDPIDYYMLIDGAQYATFDADDVIHVKFPNPFYGQSGEHLYGLSPLRAAIRNIQSSNEAIDNNNRTLKNSGAFGFLHSKGPTTMTAEQAKEIKNRMQEMRSSNEELGQMAGVSAEIGFTRIALTTDELKPFDYLNWDRKVICNVLGWSDKLLNNDEGAKYDNIKQFRQSAITDTILPDLKLLEQAFNTELLPRFKELKNVIMCFDVSELPEMQTDMKQLVDWMKEALDRGVITRNEFRAALDFPESENKLLDVFTVGMGVMPIDDALIPSTEFMIDE